MYKLPITLLEFIEKANVTPIDLECLSVAVDGKFPLFEKLGFTQSQYEQFNSWWSYYMHDEDYILNHSGYKRISTLLCYLRNKLPDTTDNVDIYEMGLSKAVDRYGANWIKLFIAYNLTNYKPLENYDMEEIRTPDLVENVEHTRNIESSVYTENDSESATGVFGFNSGNVSSPTADGTGKTETHTYGAGEDNEETNSTEKTNTGTETLTRHGNIGVTTSQQMLQSEIELRSYDLVKSIFNDIDKILTLPIY